MARSKLALSAALACLITVGTAATAAWADHHEKKPIDPSGTWRWEHEQAGETVKDVLRLNVGEEDKVVGTYQGTGEPIKIQDGKIEGDELSLQIPIEFQGQTYTIKFVGKIKDDKVDGTVSFDGDAGSQDFPWTAERGVQLSDVLGIWQLRLETPDGNVLEPTLKISKDEDKEDVEKVYDSGFGGDYLIEEFKVEDNKLQFTIVADLEGNELTAHYKGRPYGDKIQGTVEYEIGEQKGELEFTGKRKEERKAE